MANPLPKRVKIGSFWQDIVYENVLELYYRCGKVGHKDVHCSKAREGATNTSTHAVTLCWIMGWLRMTILTSHGKQCRLVDLNQVGPIRKRLYG
ncbi:hypothetical protein CFP56_002908 [Quercus suber]|uniref:CCHC-type domain-containing protein n=1 Tax=Quercus suber TaxID=58331 RepID=A0AAW0LE73_QUESU